MIEIQILSSRVQNTKRTKESWIPVRIHSSLYLSAAFLNSDLWGETSKTREDRSGSRTANQFTGYWNE